MICFIVFDVVLMNVGCCSLLGRTYLPDVRFGRLYRFIDVVDCEFRLGIACTLVISFCCFLFASGVLALVY